MIYCYINLDEAKQRRYQVEAQLKKYAEKNEEIVRIAAISPTSKEVITRKGRTRDSQKSVYLSHLMALKRAAQTQEPTLIVEDDVRLLPQTLPNLKSILNNLPKTGWDILFTDIIVTTLENIKFFHKITESQRVAKKIRIQNLQKLIYAGATSYVANPNSIHKLITQLEAPRRQDSPWDMTLRYLIHKQKIKGFVTVPFLTTVTNEANNSENQLTSTKVTDQVWNATRQLLTAPDERNKVEAEIEEIFEGLTQQQKTIAKLMGCYLSDRFVPK